MSRCCGRWRIQCPPRSRLAVEAAERISLFACFQAFLLLAAFPIQAS